MNPMNPSLLKQFITLLGNAFTRSDPAGATPTISPVDSTTTTGCDWQCVRFECVEELRVFACLAQQSEGALAAKEHAKQRLKGAFRQFSELANAALPLRIGDCTVEKAEPGTMHASFQLSGISGLEGLLLSLDTVAIAWLTANLSVPEKTEWMRTSMMDTLMDVELPVSILLASREALMSDVLQWGPGAIVEFEAGLGDPVDVIVNKQVVARGTVVLVDGNYGVRVTDVLSNDRAATTI
jgi:flagellar motor switch protein FliN